MLSFECILNVTVTEYGILSKFRLFELWTQLEYIFEADDRFVVVGENGVNVGQCVVCMWDVGCDLDGTVQYYGRFLEAVRSVQNGGK